MEVSVRRSLREMATRKKVEGHRLPCLGAQRAGKVGLTANRGTSGGHGFKGVIETPAGSTSAFAALDRPWDLRCFEEWSARGREFQRRWSSPYGLSTCG